MSHAGRCRSPRLPGGDRPILPNVGILRAESMAAIECCRLTTSKSRPSFPKELLIRKEGRLQNREVGSLPTLRWYDSPHPPDDHRHVQLRKPTPSELIAQLRGVVIGDPLPASLLGEQEPTGRDAPTAAPTDSALARLKNLLSPAAKPTAPLRKPDEPARPTPMGDITVPHQRGPARGGSAARVRPGCAPR